MNKKIINEDYFKGGEQIEKDKPIEYFLNQDEKILWKGRPKKSAYVLGKTLALMPIAIIWALIDISIIMLILSTLENLTILFFIIPFFALHLMPVWIYFYNLVKASREQKTLEFIITDSRIIVFKGVPKHIENTIDLDDMVDAKLRINFIDKILKVGDITVISSNKQIVICDVPNSVFLHSKILDICKNPSIKKEFYENKVICPYCDTMYDANETRCPSCGSTKKNL